MRCPVCKAVVEQGPQCRRCRADLSLLFDLERQAENSCTDAVRLANTGQLDEAMRSATNAAGVHRTVESQRLLALLHLVRRDFAGAFAVYQQMKRSPI